MLITKVGSGESRESRKNRNIFIIILKYRFLEKRCIGGKVGKVGSIY
jgi:hypothetical protein